MNFGKLNADDPYFITLGFNVLNIFGGNHKDVFPRQLVAQIYYDPQSRLYEFRLPSGARPSLGYFSTVVDAYSPLNLAVRNGNSSTEDALKPLLDSEQHKRFEYVTTHHNATIRDTGDLIVLSAFDPKSELYTVTGFNYQHPITMETFRDTCILHYPLVKLEQLTT